MRVYMQHIAEEAAPRFYQLWLQEDLLSGWTLVREWGKTGAKGRVKKDNFETWSLAYAALQRVRDTQILRGFKVMFTTGSELNIDGHASSHAGTSASVSTGPNSTGGMQ